MIAEPILTPEQAADAMARLPIKDRALAIMEAGDKVIDLCDPDQVKRVVARLGKA